MPDYFKSPVRDSRHRRRHAGGSRCVPATCRSCCCRSGSRRASSRSPTARTELRVRVFPDKIHLDSHEPDLTADEQTWGQHYWEQNWRAGDIKTDGAAAAADAWRQLADRFGAGRAAWIARVLQPTNSSERPNTPTPQGTALTPAPVFPAITLADSDEAWRHPPQARLLPDRWVAVVHSGGQVAVTVTGKDIRRPLAVGPDPRAPEPDEATKAAIERGEQLADRRRHEVDDRLRRGGIGGNGAAHPDPGRHADGRPRQPRRLRRRAAR